VVKSLLNKFSIQVNKIRACFYSWTHKYGHPITPEEALKRKLQELKVIVECIEEALVTDKVSRTVRKSFWTDFYKSDKVRGEVMQSLLESRDVKVIVDRYVKDEYDSRKKAKK